MNDLNAVDERNPWLGLASFTEETRAYFFGREEEVAELARRVQRKLLTVLFGQSGLGKTSILRAGLVPRLRGQGYCPVYVRIDYGRDSPEPAEQIKEAIARTARHSGQWTQRGVAVAGESLWEFLHHRDDVLHDEAGTRLIPLLIFDQFEEIFTLAQSDDFGRARAGKFLEELADLIENRPPQTLQAKFDADEGAAERFDFARSDYRVLIALREDYLAPLESLKKAMPSISQNRLRLAPMTGSQALAAVLQPGKGLVTEEVAAAIVRFVAGGAELANAEVEPSLLSLICRELNDARIAQGRAEISLDLLAGSHATILSNFYERALADQPPAVRQVIEDELLTSSGFRENIAEERLTSRFTAAGAAPNTLATLVNRRLLRIEERLDVRRVELTHDVLCAVVKTSRDLRHERETREAAERLLEEQRLREVSSRRSLVRARQIAAVCILLAVGAVLAAGFAVVSTKRAHRAEQLAEQSRAGTEHLLEYLTDEVVRDLESYGQLKVIAEFTKRQIDYFHALPPETANSESTRNGALALVHYSRAMRALGDPEASMQSAKEATLLLERLRSAGDQSEVTVIGLALAYASQAAILNTRNDPAAEATGKKSVDILAPVAQAPRASFNARRAYAEVLMRQGIAQINSSHNAEAVKIERQALDLMHELGASDEGNLDMAAMYAEASGWYINALANLGRNDEARPVGEENLVLTDKLLAQRPGFRLALSARQLTVSVLSNVAQNDLNPAEALRYAEINEAVSTTIFQLDTKSFVSANNLAVADGNIADSHWATGRLQDAIGGYQKALGDWAIASNGGVGQMMLYTYQATVSAYAQAHTGNFAAAQAALDTNKPYLKKLLSGGTDNFDWVICDAGTAAAEGDLDLERDQVASARRVASEAVKRVQPLKPQSGSQNQEYKTILTTAADVAGRAEVLLGDFDNAIATQRLAVETRKSIATDALSDRRDVAVKATWLAIALAQGGRRDEAAKVIDPIVAFARELAAKNHGDVWVSVELAGALYAQALADPKQHSALLREAAQLLDTTVPSVRATHDVRQMREMVRAAATG